MSRRLRTGTVIATLFIAAPVIGLAYSAIQQATFKDIPAGHWASQAVDYVTQQGLIQGYPDQTFRGQRNLTRYEAATIFYRLLQSGKLQGVDQQARDMITKGIDEVKGELTDLQTKQGTLETSNGQTGDRLTALENQVKTLGATPAAPTTNPDTDARIKALEDQIKALQNAPTPTPAATSPEVDARIKALEDQVKTLSTPAAPAPAAISPELDARLKALEDKVNAAPAATPAPTTSPDIEARLKALEDRPTAAAQPDTSKADAGQDTQIAALDARLKALEDRVNATPAVTPPPPAPVVTPPPTPPVDLTPPPPPPAPRVPNFTIGLGVSTPVIPNFNLNNLNIAGYVGLRRLVGPIGLRANFDYNLTNQQLSLGPDLVFEIAPTSFLDPYLGLGAGGVFGLANSLFVRGVAGLSFNFSPAFGLWLEADPRYFLLNSTGFAFSVRAGLKLSL